MVERIIKKGIIFFFLAIMTMNFVACGFFTDIDSKINKNDVINKEILNIVDKEENKRNNEKNIQNLINQAKEKDKKKDKQKLENNIEDNKEIEERGKEDWKEEEKQIPKDDDLVLIKDYIPNIYIELRYATSNNFCNTKLYTSNDAYLRYGTIKKLQKVQEIVNQDGYSLKIWDAYRPKSVQEKMWAIVPNATYVANPYNGGSSHNRGNTIDITLVNNNGEDIPMPTDFDDFSHKADRDYSDVSKDKAKNAIYLENIMSENGFKPYSGEWWHFTDIDEYPFVDYD